jgi:hypothetical protein
MHEHAVGRLSAGLGNRDWHASWRRIAPVMTAPVRLRGCFRNADDDRAVQIRSSPLLCGPRHLLRVCVLRRRAHATTVLSGDLTACWCAAAAGGARR